MKTKIKIKRKVFLTLAIIFLLAGIVGSFYVGGWLMFIKPIMACCAAYDAGALTALMVGKTIITCLLASVASGVIFWIGFLVSRIFLEVA